jgi:hypothetical protein
VADCIDHSIFKAGIWTITDTNIRITVKHIQGFALGVRDVKVVMISGLTAMTKNA